MVVVYHAAVLCNAHVFADIFPEELLNNFAQQIGAWRFCLYFLSSTRNDYVMMYSLTVFEVSWKIKVTFLELYSCLTSGFFCVNSCLM